MIEEALKGTSEEITMGALLDKISETRQTAEGRTEEEKVKREQVRVSFPFVTHC